MDLHDSYHISYDSKGSKKSKYLPKKEVRYARCVCFEGRTTQNNNFLSFSKKTFTLTNPLKPTPNPLYLYALIRKQTRPKVHLTNLSNTFPIDPYFGLHGYIHIFVYELRRDGGKWTEKFKLYEKRIFCSHVLPRNKQCLIILGSTIAGCGHITTIHKSIDEYWSV